MSALTLKVMGLSHAREALESTPEEGVQAPVLTCVFPGRLAGPRMTEGVCGQVPGPAAAAGRQVSSGVRKLDQLITSRAQMPVLTTESTRWPEKPLLILLFHPSCKAAFYRMKDL